jgi:hypothetical protein
MRLKENNIINSMKIVGDRGEERREGDSRRGLIDLLV